MKKTAITLLLLAYVAIAVAYINYINLSTVYAGPPSFFYLDSLQTESSCICVIHVKEVENILDKKSFVAVCDVLASFKGECPKTLNIEFVNKDILGKNDLAIVFLKFSKDKYLLIKEEDLTLTTDPAIHFTRGSIINIATYNKECDSDKLSLKERIEHQLTISLDAKNPSEIVRVIGWLRAIKAKPSVEVLSKLSKSQNERVALEALSFGALLQDKQAIIRLADIVIGNSKTLDAGDGDEKVRAYNERQDKESLAWLLAKVPDAVPVEYANKMLENSNDAIAHAGASILTKVGDKGSVPLLIKQLPATKKGVAIRCHLCFEAYCWRTRWRGEQAEILG